MISTQEQLLNLLRQKKCPFHLYEHPPVFTAEEAKIHCSHIKGSQVKNLFLRNKNKSIYLLITITDEKKVNLLQLSTLLETGRLSFANSNDLLTYLGVTPGSVTPLAVLNDVNKKIRVIFDMDLLQKALINIHPMVNTATIQMKRADLIHLIEETGHAVNFISLPLL